MGNAALPQVMGKIAKTLAAQWHELTASQITCAGIGYVRAFSGPHRKTAAGNGFPITPILNTSRELTNQERALQADAGSATSALR